MTPTGPQTNYGAQSIYRSYRSRYDVKVDHHFSEKNRVFGRFSHVLNRAFGTNIAVNWRLLRRHLRTPAERPDQYCTLGYPLVQPDAD